MRDILLENWHWECAQCATVRNEPFCPACVKPFLSGRVDYTPRFDGIDALEDYETFKHDRNARARFKNGDGRDLVDLLGGAS